MEKIKWIKVFTNIFENRKIKQIEKLKNGDTIVVIWFKLLCLAGNALADGKVMFSEDIPYTENMLSVEWNKPLKIIQESLKIFENFKMIEKNDNIIKICNWEKYQSLSSYESMCEQTKERMRKYRERKKETEESTKTLRNSYVTSNVTPSVTQRNSYDVEEEEELEVEKEREINNKNKNTKKKESVSVSEIISRHFFNDTTRQLLQDFVDMRKTTKKPCTLRAVEIICNKLLSLASDDETQQKIIQQSIECNWLTVYPLRVDKPTNGQIEQIVFKPQGDDEFNESFNDDDFKF